MELRDYIYILQRRFVWFITIFISTLAIFFAIYFFQKKYYIHEIKLLYQPKITSLPLQVVAKGTVDIQFTKGPDYWIQLLKKNDFMVTTAQIYQYLRQQKSKVANINEVDKKFINEIINSAQNLQVTTNFVNEISDLVSNFVNVTITSDNKFLIINGSSISMEESYLLTKAISLAYYKFGISEAVMGLEELKKYYTENLNSIQSELSNIKTSSFEKNAQLKTEYETTKMLVSDLSSQIVRLYTDRITLKEKFREATQHILSPNVKEEPTLPYKSERTRQLEKELFDAKAKLSNMQIQATPDHPEYKKLANTIKILTENIIEERRKDIVNYTKQVQNDLNELEAKIKALTKQKLDEEKKLHLLQTEYEKITSEINKSNELTKDIQAIKNEKSRIDAILTHAPNYFSFYTSFNPSLKSYIIEPVIRYVIFWLLLAVIMGIIGAYARESLDTSIKSEFDVKKYLNLNILGIIPYNAKLQLVFKNGDTIDEYIEEKTIMQELYTATASIINEHCAVKKKKILTVTSSLKYEGKSICTYNIAHALSNLNKKILLIDGDIRSPMMHTFLECENKAGFFNLDSENVNNIMININKNLDFIPTGKYDGKSIEYLARESIKEILQGFKNKYDIVLVDSPPLINVSDSLIFSKMSDGIILVIACGHTNRSIAKWAKHLLEGVNISILGVILNKAFHEVSPTYYTYYHRYKIYSKSPTQ